MDFKMIIYIISAILLLGYTLYISITDCKKMKLEYWQSGLTYLFAIFYAIADMLVANALIGKNILFHVLGCVIIFAVFLVTAMIKVKGKNSFGGADIWVAGAMGLAFGLSNLTLFVFIMAASFLLYAIGYKIKNKHLPTKTPFVPFFGIAAFILVILSLILRIA